ncbi:MAG: LysM peptidoglycan-binding domain-containing protein, partial [Planctomycetes bacterium]|nr:LysM peptidoglycan-binding domain-containing protein [Planctomycetota bacterium]
MRKRSRRRSRRRSSRRSRRNGTLSRRIGMTLMLGFLGVGGWLLLGGGHDDETPAHDPLGIHQVTAEHSPEAKAERQRDNRAYLREAADALKPIEALSGDARRVAEMAAYEKLVAILGNDMDVTTRQTIAKRFNELSERIFFTAERNELASIYVVKSGDSLDRIARNFNTTQELLCQWNDIPWERRGKIHIGQSLKYVEGSPRVVVDKSDYFLNFYFGERLAQ